MIIIAHRGNLNGPDPAKENHPDYIDNALDQGYEAEIDLWYIESNLFLGHDEPQYKIDLSYLIRRKERLWVHCKNGDALFFCLMPHINCFWHETDNYTLTSKGDIWVYPGKRLVPNSICVLPEIHKKRFNLKYNTYIKGICTDYAVHYSILAAQNNL